MGCRTGRRPSKAAGAASRSSQRQSVTRSGIGPGPSAPPGQAAAVTAASLSSRLPSCRRACPITASRRSRAAVRVSPWSQRNRRSVVGRWGDVTPCSGRVDCAGGPAAGVATGGIRSAPARVGPGGAPSMGAPAPGRPARPASAGCPWITGGSSPKDMASDGGRYGGKWERAKRGLAGGGVVVGGCFVGTDPAVHTALMPRVARNAAASLDLPQARCRRPFGRAACPAGEAAQLVACVPRGGVVGPQGRPARSRRLRPHACEHAC